MRFRNKELEPRHGTLRMAFLMMMMRTGKGSLPGFKSLALNFLPAMKKMIMIMLLPVPNL